MARILLIRPPRRYIDYCKPSVDLPLGILYIAGVLERGGHEVRLFDALAQTDVYSDWDWRGEKHFGAPWSVIEQEIRESQPQIVGITNQFTIQLQNALKVAQIAKEVDPGILTVVGGNHATIQPSTFLGRSSPVDVACLGEGEYTMVELATCIAEDVTLGNVQGIAFKGNSAMVVPDSRRYLVDIDQLPLPAYHLVDLERYFDLRSKGYGGRDQYAYKGSDRAISLITSRGCPFNCVFCSIHLHMGRRWRAHSAKYVLEHIDVLVTRYGIHHLHIEDDNLTLNRTRFEEILDGLIAREYQITWDTPNGIRADLLSQELLLKSKQSGCLSMFVGVESGCQDIIDRVVKKKLDLNKVVKVAKWCKEIGLDLGAFFVIGFPGETVDDMKTTLDFALDLESRYGVLPVLMVATPLVGTDLYRICVSKGYLTEQVTAQSLAKALLGSGMIRTKEFSPADISHLRKYFYSKHKPLFVFKFCQFLMSHPRAAWRFVSNLAAYPQKETLLSNMSFRNCLIRSLPQTKT